MIKFFFSQADEFEGENIETLENGEEFFSVTKSTKSIEIHTDTPFIGLKQRAADTSDADDKPRKLMFKKNIKRLKRPSDSSQILSVSEVRTESHDEAPEVWNFYRSAPSSDLGIAPDYPANGVLLLNQMGWTDSNLPQRPVTPLQYAQSVVTPQNYTQSDYFDPFDSTQPTGFSFGGAPSIG